MRILLVVYDNDSYTSFFPQGIAYIAASLRDACHMVQIYNQDIHHYPDEYLTDYLNRNKFDMIGVGIIAGYYQYRKLLSLAYAINNSRQRPFVVLGGHGPTPAPGYFLRKTQADVVVMGEGERTIIELCQHIEDTKDFSSINGIAFWDGDRVIVNPRRDLIQDVDSITPPAYNLFPIEQYRMVRKPHAVASDFVFPVLTARGCTYQCTFCYRMDKGYRPRSNDGVLEEIGKLQRDYRINYFIFSDELFMGSIAGTVSRCEAFLSSGLRFKWSCDGRLNYATPEVLKLMELAGCQFINYGIEAMDDKVLRNIKKGLKVKQIHEGVKNTIDAGISPGLNLLWGNIGDNIETLRKATEFLLRYDDSAQLRTIRPVTPYPGSPLYDYAVKSGKLEGVEDFYENKHVNSDLLAVNFTEMDDNQFHKALCRANKTLINNYYGSKTKQAIEETEDLYYRKNVAFRGYRQT